MRGRLSVIVMIASFVIGACGGSGAPTASGPVATDAPELSASARPTATPTPPAVGARPSPTATPVVAATPTPTPRPTATPTPTPRLTATPTPTPRPPAAFVRVGNTRQHIAAGDDHVDVTVEVVARRLDQSRCTLKHRIEPDDPAVPPSTRNLEPRTAQVVGLIDGVHSFRLSCPSSAGTLESHRQVRAWDGLPERCRGFDVPDAPISISTFEELEAGMIGDWQGCVTTPWTPAYWVAFTFRDDGTYSAATDEEFDGVAMNAMYYGIQADSPYKRWALNDLQASNKGVGQIDIIWGSGPDTSRGDLRNIELMGDELQFEFFHFGDYGPVTFNLERVAG